MKFATFTFLVAALGLSGCAHRLPRIGDVRGGPLLDTSVVRHVDAQSAKVPFRVYPMFIEGVSERLTFTIEIDGPLWELYSVSLSSGSRTAPKLVTPLSYFTNKKGMNTVSFEITRDYEGELWLTFALKASAANEKGVIYSLDLKSWPIIYVDTNKQKREEKWPNQ